MDAQAKKKAIFRAKLNAQKKEKRIDSPLVRYNESDQPVCRVCNVVLKSESNWDAHQVSSKHHEAINNLKASAATLRQGSVTKTASPMDTGSADSQQLKLDTSERSSKRQKTSGLPPNFFDNHDSRIKKADTITSVDPLESYGGSKKVQQSKQTASSETKQVKGSLPEGFFDKKEADLISSSTKATSEPKQTPILMGGSQMKPVVKGALPEGFFDNKDADLLARGIKPVKPDIKDEYKEFEKVIQEDLQLVDSRMEEEEIDAAELIEEEEQLEQRSYKEKVEMLKRKKVELKAARAAERSMVPKVLTPVKESSNDEESSSEDEDDENLTVDWRAQHL